MGLFSRNKQLAVQTFLLKVVNNTCPELISRLEGPRLEGRVNLTMAVRVVPLDDGVPLLRKSFAAVTKEFSTTGIAVVMDQPRGLDEAMIGIRWRGNMTWMYGKAKHLSPIGGGFFQLGFRLTEMAASGDHPELEPLGI